MNLYFHTSYRMKCASAEAENRKYKMIIGKSNLKWLVAIQENEADNIYVEGEPNCYGFGGRDLTFELEDSSEITLRGPWHSNADSLYSDTGYDIRDKYLTQGICSLDIDYSTELYKDVLHYDKNPVVGEYNRVNKIAQEFANKLNKTVYYCMRTSGGSERAQVDPKQ